MGSGHKWEGHTEAKSAFLMQTFFGILLMRIPNKNASPAVTSISMKPRGSQGLMHEKFSEHYHNDSRYQNLQHFVKPGVLNYGSPMKVATASCSELDSQL